MTAVTLEKPKEVLTFPMTEVEAVLRRELLASVEFEASIRGVSIPKTPTEVVRLAIDTDSLVVVDTLCAVEPVLGFELRGLGSSRRIPGASMCSARSSRSICRFCSVRFKACLEPTCTI